MKAIEYKILVTGSSGFIGSCLIERLEKYGYEHIEYEGDIRDKQAVDEAVKDRNIVFHLAAICKIPETEGDPRKAYEVNTLGTENVINACRKHDAKLIYTSTSGIYGKAIQYPTPEDALMLPQGWYGMTKILAELKCDPAEDFILRPGGVFGPQPESHCVLNKFVKLIRKGRSIPMYNNELDTREYVFIDDVIDALLMGLDHTGIYNIAYGAEISVIELLDTISEVLNIPYTTRDMHITMPAEQGKTQRVWLDVEKLKSIDWKPKVNLEEGIRKTAYGNG